MKCDYKLLCFILGSKINTVQTYFTVPYLRTDMLIASEEVHLLKLAQDHYRLHLMVFVIYFFSVQCVFKCFVLVQ